MWGIAESQEYFAGSLRRYFAARTEFVEQLAGSIQSFRYDLLIGEQTPVADGLQVCAKNISRGEDGARSTGWHWMAARQRSLLFIFHFTRF